MPPRHASTPTPRERFREAVLARDRGRCVRCGVPAVDVHHLLDRHLFPDGGYDRDNGVALCAPCHLDAELTLVAPDELRARAGIVRIVAPPGLRRLEPGERHTKWGCVECADGSVEPGPLFATEPVQKVLRRSGQLWRYRTPT